MAKRAPLETKFQTALKKEIVQLLPGRVYVMKMDSQDYQGMPDLLVIWEDCWAILEVKRSAPAPSDYQPNQEWYIDVLNSMSFSSVIYPEIKEEVLNALQQSFFARREARNALR